MATFKKKINAQQFINMCRDGDTQGVINAINLGANIALRTMMVELR